MNRALPKTKRKFKSVACSSMQPVKLSGICLFFLLLIFGFGIKNSNAQEFKLIKSLPVTANFFTTDRLGNFYMITQNEIRKFDADGNFLDAYNYKDLGILNFIDATDPFKVMLFQPDFLKIRTLDTRLNVIGELDLNYLQSVGLPRLACVSDDGNYWIYDQQNQRLIKIDSKGVILLTGISFSQFIDQSLSPRSLVATDTWLLMRNVDSTVYVFDRFGNYFRSVMVNSSLDFQANGNLILFYRDNKMYSLNVANNSEKMLETPDLSGVTTVRMEQHRLFLKKNDLIEIYSY